jgi:glycerol-3-phosphate dehydrogenase (NAD(P)+)
VRPDEPVAIIGAGSWGTALAAVLGRAGIPVRLWGRRKELVARLSQQRANEQYLPGITLPNSVQPCEELGQAIDGAPTIVLVVPAVGMREQARRLGPLLNSSPLIISAAKGLEEDTGLRMSEVIAQEIPSAAECVVAMSGPNLAIEVARGIATTTVVACPDLALARRAQALLMQPSFRVYTNADIIGVEMGGALKNIVAIAAGSIDGLGFGDNTKAALVTRGLAEIRRLGVAMGARAETFGGLSGMGDMVATCASRHSRNHYVGFMLAQGKTLDQILAPMDQIAEGVPTTRAALALAQRASVEMPIAQAVHSVLFEGVPAKTAVAGLMTRAGKDELDEPWLSAR